MLPWAADSSGKALLEQWAGHSCCRARPEPCILSHRRPGLELTCACLSFPFWKFWFLAELGRHGLGSVFHRTVSGQRRTTLQSSCPGCPYLPKKINRRSSSSLEGIDAQILSPASIRFSTYWTVAGGSMVETGDRLLMAVLYV